MIKSKQDSIITIFELKSDYYYNIFHKRKMGDKKVSVLQVEQINDTTICVEYIIN